MKLFRFIIFLLLLFCYVLPGFSQDTLPQFSVKNRFGKIIVSWVNGYPDLVQISIQRSTDSLKGYKTITTVPDATSITNGFLDSKAPALNSFYRLYVQQSGGKYFFTKPSRPVVDSSKTVKYEIAKNNQVVIKRNGQGDSSISPPKVPELRPIYVPSSFVFTNPDGNVSIILPDAKTMNYTLKFYTEDDRPLFQMAKVKEDSLTLDKSNFIKSGWFKFELYENSVLKEKRKFFIPKDQR